MCCFNLIYQKYNYISIKILFGGTSVKYNKAFFKKFSQDDKNRRVVNLFFYSNIWNKRFFFKTQIILVLMIIIVRSYIFLIIIKKL